MLIDVNAWCGRWPFVPRVSTEPAAIADELAAIGVTAAHAASLEAVLSPDPVWEERQLARRLAGVALFVPSPVVHPLRLGWRDELRRAADAGAKMVRLTPSYHGYDPDAPAALALADAAADAGLLVALVMRIEDERRHHPLTKVSAPSQLQVRHLADRLAPRPLLVLAAYIHEIKALGQAGNVRCDLSFCEFTDPAGDAVAAVGAERLLFGTHAPLLYPTAQRMKLDCSTLDAAARRAVEAGNADALLG